MKKHTPLLIYIVLAIMDAAGAFMCACWLPIAIEYMANFLPLKALLWFCGFIAIPFFAILAAAFAFPRAVANDTVFSAHTAKLIHIIAMAVLSDCILLGAVAVWLLCAGEGLLSPVLLFVALIGITVAIMFFILSRYVNHAAILKEEADATL